MSLRTALKSLVGYFDHEIETPALQSGVIPYRRTADGIEYLLITSRRSARWMFPKGKAMNGMTLWQSAAVEAMEEAGIVGAVGQETLGTYQGTLNSDPLVSVTVALFAFEVLAEQDDWLERDQRLRRWFDLEEAVTVLGDPDREAILRRFDSDLRRTGA